MAGFVEGMDRRQATLLPECLEDWVGENNAVRAVDVFVDALDLAALGFEGVQKKWGQPPFRPVSLCKLDHAPSSGSGLIVHVRSWWKLTWSP
jgi:transposase